MVYFGRSAYGLSLTYFTKAVLSVGPNTRSRQVSLWTVNNRQLKVSFC